MRIAHVIDYFHTDVGYQEYYLAKNMAEAGHTVRVISSGFRQHTVATPGPDEVKGREALEAAGVEIVRLASRQLGHDRAWLRGLEQNLAEFRPDAIHCHGPFAPTTFRTVRTKRSLGCSVLVDNHLQKYIAPASHTLLGGGVYRAYRAIAAPYLRRQVDRWVAIGPYEREFLSEHMGIELDDIEMVPLGFDPSIFNHDPARREKLRAESGWSADTVVAVTGKLNARKRADLVAAACSAGLEEGHPFRLVIAGDVEPDALAAIEEEAVALRKDGRLEIKPMLGREDLADLYRCADVVVFARLPSISIYEAAGTGSRVLVGRDRFGEWLQSQLPLIETVEPDDLLTALMAGPVAGDRADRAQRALEVFSWERLSARFVDLYGASR